MTAAEQPLVFDCAGDALVGVLALPPSGCPASDLGVLIVVGGPQYRAGSHRQYVRLARVLAGDGHAVLRFDVRGMGDSEGEARSFEALDDDIEAAVAALRANAPQVRRIVLWGLCDGASAALLHCARRRPRGLAGLCLVNPWLRSEQSRARTQFRVYYRQRLLQPAFWRKLLSGGVAVRAVRDLWANLRASVVRRDTARAGGGPASTDFRVAMAQGWHGFDGPILLVLCGEDFTAREFLEGVATLPPWGGALTRPGVLRLDVPGADHTFSSSSARDAVEHQVRRWLDSLRRTPD